MLTKFYKKFLTFFSLFLGFLFLAQYSLAAVKSVKNITGSPFSTMTGLVNTIFTIARWFEIIVIVLAVIFLLMGAFNYITAGGDSDALDRAKKYLQYGILGIVLAAAAEGIVRAVAWVFGITL